MQVGETVENYLETILILLKEHQQVRSVDLANEMGYSKPTISIMMRQLRQDGFVKVNRSGHIRLTPSGQAIAEKVYERHLLLTEILVQLGVEEKTALEDACKIEHNLSDESFACIKRFYSALSEQQEGSEPPFGEKDQ